MKWETGLLKVGWHQRQHGLVLAEGSGSNWADVKRAVRQPLLWDLAFKTTRGMHLNVVLEALFRAQVLGVLAHAGGAAGRWAEL